MGWEQAAVIIQNVNEKTAIKVQNIVMSTSRTTNSFTATIREVDPNKAIIIPAHSGSYVTLNASGVPVPRIANFVFENSTTIRCDLNANVEAPSFALAIIEFANVI